MYSRLLLLALAALLPTGCGGEAPSARSESEPGPNSALDASPVVIDDAEREVRLPAPARRIISLVPARTEAILALGAGDRLIARTQYDLDPRLSHLPSVGNALNPSLEWLAAQRPDLVIAWADGEARSVIERLSQVGIAAYATRVETLAGLDRSLADLGVLLGVEAAADSLRLAIADTLAAVHGRAEARNRPSVLYLVGLDPPLTAGPNTFVGELIAIAGGENLFADLTQPWPSISVEEAVRRNPDVIVFATASPAADPAARFRSRPGWRDTRAVRAGAVFDVDADLFNRAGPRLGEAAVRLERLLHHAATPAVP